MKIIVIGAGLAGLTAAALAADKGADVVVLERSGESGGRARSSTHAGDYVMNMGPHALYEAGGGAAILDQLGVDRSGRPPVTKGSLADLDGDLTPLPQTATGILTSRLLSWRGRAQVGRVLVGLGRGAPVNPVVSWGDWLDARVSDPHARQFLSALGRVTTYAADPAISASIVLQQIAIGTDPGVRYLDGGWQLLIVGLQAAARARGADLRRTGATEVTTDGNRIVVTTDEGDLTTDAVIVAAGSPRATRGLLARVGPDALHARLEELVPVQAACLDVALDHLPRPDRPFALGLDQTTYASVHSLAADLAPDGGAVIHAARYLPNGLTDATADRARLEDLLDRLQPGWRDHVVDARFLPSITVTHDLAPEGLPGRVPVDVGPGIALAGDWVGARGWLADASLLSAEDAVAAVLAPASTQPASAATR